MAIRSVSFLTLFLTVVARVEYARLYGNIFEYAYYFVDLLVGKPHPQRQSVILDTGSSVLAFACTECQGCGKHIDEPFDFSKSATAKWKECNSSCTCRDGKCTYYQGYTEGSSIAGIWFNDYAALGDSTCGNAPVRMDMGCHTRETKLFVTQKASGIMGVAFPRGSHSTIIDALFDAKRGDINTRMFAICLAEYGGMFAVGGSNELYHEDDRSIAYTNLAEQTYYSIKVESISVPKRQMSYDEAVVTNFAPAMLETINGQFGHTIVDSGTTYTYLATSLFKNW